ncbi:glycosyltransferase family 4 protein [Mucilaginibacter corticis]|uniref:Glycosyltransferase family 4 protein n=1 Tax=Mucilaginibacter corticis TaxID=2597670 RepID=A0A556M7S0_9SPHI|nr:glycosyltransferase family 4 protein [Mucilaginibacter corticis]TSJ35961.1 glycosyltransferase family 4 protein [Mucilaginibacter corticis]
MKKQIIFNRLFEYGGSNTHLEALILYFGKENIVLILEEESQLTYLPNIKGGSELKTIVDARLHKFAHLVYPSVFSNIREFVKILRSLWRVGSLAIKHGTNEITLCVVDPEKYLYLLWLPFFKVTYILHSTPHERYTPFTSFTCNSLLGRRKRIVTVSNANKEAVMRNWSISAARQLSVKVVYNCAIANQTTEPQAGMWAKGLQYIVTMGHTVAYKNPSFWLEVARSVTAEREGVRFLWFGDGPLLQELKSAAIDNPAIVYYGSVNGAQAYLKNATIYYQPSLYETHGIAVVEAMANRLPCVVAQTGGLVESIEDGYNGIVVSTTDILENKNALISLIDDPALRESYGIRSYEKYQRMFSFEAFKTRMDTIYKN